MLAAVRAKRQNRARAAGAVDCAQRRVHADAREAAQTAAAAAASAAARARRARRRMRACARKCRRPRRRQRLLRSVIQLVIGACGSRYSGVRTHARRAGAAARAAPTAWLRRPHLPPPLFAATPLSLALRARHPRTTAASAQACVRCASEPGSRSAQRSAQRSARTELGLRSRMRRLTRLGVRPRRLGGRRERVRLPDDAACSAGRRALALSWAARCARVHPFTLATRTSAVQRALHHLHQHRRHRHHRAEPSSRCGVGCLAACASSRGAGL
jgi:hypothetical protein